MSSTLTATGPLGEERQSKGRPIPCWTGRRALGVNHLPANCQERLLTIVYIKQGGIQTHAVPEAAQLQGNLAERGEQERH